MDWQPQNPDFEAVIRASFASQSLMQTYHATLEKVAPGAIEIHAPIGGHVLQQQGFAHGGFAFALGDSAAGYAAMSLQPVGVQGLTLEMKVNYLAPGSGPTLVSRGRVIVAGAKIITVAADVFARSPEGHETPVATMLGTMYLARL